MGNKDYKCYYDKYYDDRDYNKYNRNDHNKVLKR